MRDATTHSDAQAPVIVPAPHPQKGRCSEAQCDGATRAMVRQLCC